MDWCNETWWSIFFFSPFFCALHHNSKRITRPKCLRARNRLMTRVHQLHYDYILHTAQLIVQHIFHFNLLKKLKDALVHTAVVIHLLAHNSIHVWYGMLSIVLCYNCVFFFFFVNNRTIFHIWIDTLNEVWQIQIIRLILYELHHTHH